MLLTERLVSPAGYGGSQGSCIGLPGLKCTSLVRGFPISKKGIMIAPAPGEKLRGQKEL